MENASKALLIAGAMLLAILLLSIFAFINSKIAGSTSNLYGQLKESDITEFNQRFLNYEEKAYKLNDKNEQIGLTIQDVVSLAHLAIDSNKRTNFPIKVEVILQGRGNLAEFAEKDLENLLIEYSDQIYRKCNMTYAPKSKLIGRVEISI